jgi:hypothetical protein
MKRLGPFVKHILFENGNVELAITGNSMVPLYKNGDILTIVPLPQNGRLLPGMCCVYVSQNQLVLHRILFTIADFVFTAGDSCFLIEKIHKQNILGTPVTHTPHTKHLLVFSITCLFLPFYHFLIIFKLRSKCIHFLLKERHNNEKKRV